MAIEQTGELGSLAQSGRLKELRNARITMYVVGVITLVVNVGLGVFAEQFVKSQFDTEIAQLRQQGMELDMAQVDVLKKQAVTGTQLASLGFAVMGIVFILFGVFIEKAPVPITVLALILYIGGQAITALHAGDPKVLTQGLVIKIVIIAVLAKAIQAALAYQREAATE